MATYLRRSRPSSAEDCSIATILLLLWFLAGHPLALYADTQDDFDGLGGAEELTRKSRADIAAPLPDPLQAPDDEGRRLHAPWRSAASGEEEAPSRTACKSTRP